MQKEIISDNSLIKKDIITMASRARLPDSHNADSVVQYRKPEALSGQVIDRIASSHYYIHDDITVDDLLMELNRNLAVSSVGVIEKSGSIIGVVTRDMFFDILGRPFGRDLYKNKQIRKITLNAKRFKTGDNIFSVAEELSSDLMMNRDIHYVLADIDERFVGVFTNRDLLMYLSYLTRSDLDFAKKIQLCIIKDETVVRNGRYEMLAATKMAKDVGGDYYTMKKYSDTKWFMAVCDVAGKGISAALLSVLLGGVNHIFDFTMGIKQYVEKLNDYIYTSFKSEKFITGIFADFDESTGRIKIFDAGHSYIFLVRDKRIINLDGASENLPIGISPAYNPVSYSIKLKRDDLLVVFTDGIEGQTNAENERYGLDRFRDFFNRPADENLKIIKDSIFHDIRKFRDKQTQDDDITILLLRYLA